MLSTRPELRLRLAHMNALFALCLLAVQPSALWCRSLDVRAQAPSPHSSESESESWESPEVEPQAPIGAHTRNNIAELLLPLIERGLSSERRPAHSKKVIQVLPLRSKASKERQPWPHLNSRKKHVVEITPLRSKGRDGKPLAYILSPAKSEMRRNYPKRTDRHHADHEHKDHNGHRGWKAKLPSESSSTEEASVEGNDNIISEEEQVTNEKITVTSEESEADASSEESNDVSKDKGISVSEEPYDDSLSVASSPSDEADTQSRSDNDYTKSTTSESGDSTQNKQESDYTSASSLNSESSEDDRKGSTPPFLFSESDSQDIVDEKSSPENNNLSQSVSSTENSKQTSEALSSESQNQSEDNEKERKNKEEKKDRPIESKSVTGGGSIETPISNENKTDTEERIAGNTTSPEVEDTPNTTEKIETTTIQAEISTISYSHSHENSSIIPHEEENEITVKSDGKANDSQNIDEHSNNHIDEQESDESKKDVSQLINQKEGHLNEGINNTEEKDAQLTDGQTKDSEIKEQSKVANGKNSKLISEGDQSKEGKETSKDGKEDHSKDDEKSKTKNEKDSSSKSTEETLDSSNDEHVGDKRGDKSKKKVIVTSRVINTTVTTESEEPTKERKLADGKEARDEKHYKTHHEMHHGSNQRNLYKENSQHLRPAHKYSEVGPAEKLKKNNEKNELRRRNNVTIIHPDSNDSISIGSSEDKSGDQPSDANEYKLDNENLEVIGPNLTSRKLDNVDNNLEEDGKIQPGDDKDNKAIDKSSNDSLLVNGLDKSIITDKPNTSTAHDVTQVSSEIPINHPDKNESIEANKSDGHVNHDDSAKAHQTESAINENHIDDNVNKDIVRNVQLIDELPLPLASILRSDDIAHPKSHINELQLSTPITPGYQRNDIVITQRDHLNKWMVPRSRDIIELIQTSEGVERVTPAQCEPHDDKQNDHAHEHKSYRLSFLFNK